MRFLGIDWGEHHHELCLLDQDGRVLAARRIGDGLAGAGELHQLVAAHAEQPGQVAVGIETDRGLLVGAMVAAGYQVYAVNPQVVSHYRSRHGSSRAKSDRGMPRCWPTWSAPIVRLPGPPAALPGTGRLARRLTPGGVPGGATPRRYWLTGSPSHGGAQGA